MPLLMLESSSGSIGATRVRQIIDCSVGQCNILQHIDSSRI